MVSSSMVLFLVHNAQDEDEQNINCQHMVHNTQDEDDLSKNCQHIVHNTQDGVKGQSRETGNIVTQDKQKQNKNTEKLTT